MSMFGNVNFNSPDGTPKTDKQDEQKPQTSVRDFVNNLNLFADTKLTGAQKAQVSQQASIFFGQFDTDGVSGLSDNEQKIANANVNKFVTDMQTKFAQEAAPVNPAQQIANQSVTANALKEDLQGLQEFGFKVTNDSSGAIILERNGQTGKIEIGDDGNMKLSGCAEEALQALANKTNAGKVGITPENFGKLAQLGLSLISDPQDNVQIRSEDDQIMGTISKNSDGQYEFDTASINVNKFATIKHYEGQGYQFSGWGNEQKTELIMTKDGQEIRIKLDEKTGQEIKE